MIDVKRILVAADFSPCSKAALAHALYFAERLGASVDVMHVWQVPDYTSPDLLVQIPGEAQHTLGSFAQHKAELALQAFLAEAAARPGVRLEGRLEPGEPVATIVRAATEGYYDLVVVGTHGRTGLSHMVMGSVAEKIARGAPCPVVVVRAPERSVSHDVAR